MPPHRRTVIRGSSWIWTAHLILLNETRQGSVLTAARGMARSWCAPISQPRIPPPACHDTRSRSNNRTWDGPRERVVCRARPERLLGARTAGLRLDAAVGPPREIAAEAAISQLRKAPRTPQTLTPPHALASSSWRAAASRRLPSGRLGRIRRSRPLGTRAVSTATGSVGSVSRTPWTRCNTGSGPGVRRSRSRSPRLLGGRAPSTSPLPAPVRDLPSTMWLCPVAASIISSRDGFSGRI
jgi:hypothetical protein